MTSDLKCSRDRTVVDTMNNNKIIDVFKCMNLKTKTHIVLCNCAVKGWTCLKELI